MEKRGEMLTWPIADRCIERNAEDAYIKGRLRARETLDMFEMSESINSGKSPLSTCQRFSSTVLNTQILTHLKAPFPL